MGRGTCNASGVCECTHGYGGVDCADLACPNGCSGHGRCLGYGSPSRACKCDEGWGGDDCSTRTCDGGCGAHGACVNVRSTAKTRGREAWLRCEKKGGAGGAALV
jgi:hypothetical protein